jgi:hypothetical protein
MKTSPRKLRQKYNKLTVLSESTINGRRYAQVKCECGRTKDVLAESLWLGRTKSCAQGACKAYKRQKREKGFVPRPPRACTAATVRKAWERYHHPEPAKRRSLAQLAVIHKVNLLTLTTLFRSVRRAGGIEAYMRAVT